MAKIRLLVSCATGIATSTAASDKIKRLLQARGFEVETLECKVAEVASRVQNFRADAIVSTTPVSVDVGVKVFSGMPLLTGIGADALADQIAAYVRTPAQ